MPFSIFILSFFMKGATTDSSLNRWLALVKFSVPGANATRREVFIDYYCTATTQLSARTDEAKRISLPSMRSSWSLIRRIPQTSSPALYSSFPRVRKQLQNRTRFEMPKNCCPRFHEGHQCHGRNHVGCGLELVV